MTPANAPGPCILTVGGGWLESKPGNPGGGPDTIGAPGWGNPGLSNKLGPAGAPKSGAPGGGSRPGGCPNKPGGPFGGGRPKGG